MFGRTRSLVPTSRYGPRKLDDPDLAYAAQDFLMHLERVEMELKARAAGAARLPVEAPDTNNESGQP